MASGLQLQDIGATYSLALADMASWLKDAQGSPTAETMLPQHRVQADIISPAEEKMLDSWLPANEDAPAADVSTQQHGVSGQQAASIAGQGHVQPAPSKETVLGSWLPAQEDYSAADDGVQPCDVSWQQAASATRQGHVQPAPSRPRGPPDNCVEQGQSSRNYFDDLDDMHAMMYPTPPVHQQQFRGSPWLQSSAPFAMMPSTHPGPTLISCPPPADSSGAMPGGLGAGSWLDSTPMQPHMDAPLRLPTLRTPGSVAYAPFQQSDHSQAALAGQSPDSAKSARMAWHLLNGQAVGQREPAAADVASSGLHRLQTRLSDASHARPQHMQHAQHVQRAADGAVTPARLPRSHGRSAARRPDITPNAALLPSGTGQKRKAAQQQVFQGQVDNMDSALLQQLLHDLPPAAFEGNWGGSGGSAAHAGGQHLQLGGMAQVQALAQQLLPALAAVETKQPRKRQKTTHTSSAPRAVHRAPVPAASPAAAPAAQSAQGPGYQVEQVVWAKSGEWPWWPATVQEPDADQRRATKMGADTDTDKVFLVYFKTQEIEALPKKQVRQWGAHKASLHDLEGHPQLPDAVHLAKQAIRSRTQ